MMSIETIRNQGRQAAQKAAREHKHPLLVEQDDLISTEVLKAHLHKLPTLGGDYTPRGFKELDVRNVVAGYPYRQFFVDHSGFDDGSGAALTQTQFVQQVQLLGPGYAYAIGDIGQFQLDVRIFQKG